MSPLDVVLGIADSTCHFQISSAPTATVTASVAASPLATTHTAKLNLTARRRPYIEPCKTTI